MPVALQADNSYDCLLQIFILSRAVFHWNILPLETVACSTLEQFNQAVCKIDHVSP